MSAPALVLEDVVKRAGRRVVIDRASAAFHRGELSVVRSGRGAERTALSRLLSGAAYPDAGRIRRSGLPAPIVGASVGFQSGAPVLRGLELRAAAYGLDFRSFRERIATLLDDPETLTQDFGRLAGAARQAVLFGASYCVPAPIYVIDGSPLPTEAGLRAKLRPLFEEARRNAAVIWIAEEKTALDAWRPERLFRLSGGALNAAENEDA